MTIATAPCDYELLENEIHCFTFNDVSHTAIDIFYDKLGEIHEANLDLTPLRMMIISETNSIPSVAYLKGRSRHMIETYQRASTRACILFDAGPMSFILDSLMRMSHKRAQDAMRAFKRSDREKAIAWLIEE